MAKRIPDEQLVPGSARGRRMFIERYPDYPSWLDGNTWELDIETEIEIHETLNSFRGSLHYQARTMGLRLTTRVHDTGGRKVLRLRAT